MSDPIRDACLPCKTCLIRPKLKIGTTPVEGKPCWYIVCQNKKHRNATWGLTTAEAVSAWNKLYGTTGPQEIVEIPKETNHG